MNSEYRFPIVNIDRGPSTVPIFFNRLNGTVFFDMGTAFDDAAKATLLKGAGGELWLDMMLAYNVGITLRLGFARGFDDGGLTKVYFVAASTF
jgi:hypothetical protein